jgi:hypothetical protein
MARRDPAPSAAPRPSRRRAFAAWVLVTGLLLFTWPFVRVPRFHVVPAWLHLLGAWALVVAALAALARALGREEAEDRDA